MMIVRTGYYRPQLSISSSEDDTQRQGSPSPPHIAKAGAMVISAPQVIQEVQSTVNRGGRHVSRLIGRTSGVTLPKPYRWAIAQADESSAEGSPTVPIKKGSLLCHQLRQKQG